MFVGLSRNAFGHEVIRFFAFLPKDLFLPTQSE
jgi:hypothetical protein